MARLCERPGCSTPAACVYGIDSKRLSVWIEGTLPDDAGSSALGKRAGVLCRRHADSMVVPIGWTLDDRRGPATVEPAAKRVVALPQITRRRARREVAGQSEQLALLEVELDASPPAARGGLPFGSGGAPEDAGEESLDPVDTSPSPSGQAASSQVGPDPIAGAEPATLPPASPWRPVFDQTDDLGGLLATRSPLLSRAFGKRDRSTDGDGAPER